MAVAIRNEIQFLLNDKIVRLPDITATQTLLDFLRLDKVLRGTKEGCAEGDCGACTVLVGRLHDGALRYESVNACIRFVASLDGCHVVTIEHLKGEDGTLHPVQQAMVEQHGSQCGFCTPGVVMSLYGLWMENPGASIDEIEQALQGNLCRCTGYAPIIRAMQAISAAPNEDPLVAERATTTATLKQLHDGARVASGGDDAFVLPADVDDLASILQAQPEGTIIAGSTDVSLWVNKLMRDISPVVFIGHLEELKRIETRDGVLNLGAGVTYAEAASSIAEQFPQMAEFWSRIGGAQVRNMGTIGGNIANGSPIGDTPPPLIALGASIVLRKGEARRTIKLEDYFAAYGKQDRQLGEFVESIQIPCLPENNLFAVYKISKRRDEDISSVCGALRVRVEGGKIREAIIAFGGMAATPKRATAAEAVLIGQPMALATFEAAATALAKDYQPISDMRASADYRLLVAQNLLRRFYLESAGETAQFSRGAA